MVWDDLNEISMLGEGSFGRVKLVLHKPTQTPFALKCLHKGQLVRYQQVDGSPRPTRFDPFHLVNFSHPIPAHPIPSHPT